MKSRLFGLIVIAILGLILSACGESTAAPSPTATAQPMPTPRPETAWHKNAMQTIGDLQICLADIVQSTNDAKNSPESYVLNDIQQAQGELDAARNVWNQGPLPSPQESTDNRYISDLIFQLQTAITDERNGFINQNVPLLRAAVTALNRVNADALYLSHNTVQ